MILTTLSTKIYVGSFTVSKTGLTNATDQAHDEFHKNKNNGVACLDPSRITNEMIYDNFLFFLSRKFTTDSAFVPKHRVLKACDVELLSHFFNSHRNILVLTGAGMSTESGMPDYRSEGVGLYARSNYRPIQYQEFVKSPYARKRYWARSYFGWPRIAALQPSPAMHVLANLKDKLHIITQNVDGLHTKAGSPDVVELHGSLHQVVCLQCGDLTPRNVIQRRMAEANTTLNGKLGAIRPDGDVEITEEQVNLFKQVDCMICGGILKPNIVFFGDNVPSERVMKVNSLVEMSDALLVLGSSLTTYSSYRIAVLSNDLKKKIFIVNIGDTRGDSLAAIKLRVKLGDILTSINVK